MVMKKLESIFARMERFEDGEVLRKYTDNCVKEGCETIHNKLNKKLS